MIGYIVAVMIIGAFIIQDGAASIWYYIIHKDGETWKRNHSWRLARIAAGIALIILGSKLLGV